MKNKENMKKCKYKNNNMLMLINHQNNLCY